MLANPSPDDWLMYSRTYDAQRFSPLKQITRQNVGQLREVFKKELGTGNQESIPIVLPGRACIWPLRAPASWRSMRRPARRSGSTSGRSGASRTKAIAIYEDMVFYASPDGFIVALDARTGAVRWETKSSGNLTSGVIVADGKVLSGRACGTERDNCYISAHDAQNRKGGVALLHRAGGRRAGRRDVGRVAPGGRLASPWGLAGGYDPVRRLIFWGVANPMPNTRAARHGGNARAIPLSSPADLYSNSTVALNPDTGKLVWYYQHLPGDDWDLDYTNERVLVRTAVSPDPKFVKWINPDIPRGQQRDIALNVGEGGGIWALDRDDRPVPLGQSVPVRHARSSSSRRST